MASKSTVLSASAAINAKAGIVYGIGLTAGGDAASILIKDGGTGGTAKTAALTEATTVSGYWSFPKGINCATSIYATITGTTPDCFVVWED